MRLWADVYSAAGARLGDGPVMLTSAAVTRVLDGIGTIRFSVPGTDTRARALLLNERRVRLWFQAHDGVTPRQIGSGIIRQVRASGTPADWSLDLEGPDDLDGLARVSTKLGRKYSAQTVSTIASSLVGLVSGWSVSASGGEVTDARFDGVSVFKALLALAQQQGLHVRAGTSTNTVEVGAFGTAAGLRLVNPIGAPPAIDAADEIALIETISVEQNSEAVCTRLYPIGAGIGEAWLTIFKADRNLPYTRQVANINGIDQHFLEDFAAVALYGVIEKMGRFGDIAPLTNSEADQKNAANALYDAAAAWLSRYSQRQDVYQVTAHKVRTTLRPGDKVRLVYNGVVERDGMVSNFIDVDGDMWVMEVTERVGLEGASVDLVLSSVDRQAQDAARVVIGALEELSVDGVTVKPYFNRSSWVYDRVIDPFFPASVPVVLTNATQRLNRCRVRVRTRAFISTARSAVTNTTHRHSILQSGAGTGPYYYRDVIMYDQATNATFRALLPVSIESAAFLAQTDIETNEDFITVNYGLQQDTQTPAGLRVFVNNIDRTTALGGPWLVSGGAGMFEVDVTQWIESVVPLQQEHIVRIECTSGQGEVEVTVEVYETIQAIAVS
jgi:hypothetical protein